VPARGVAASWPRERPRTTSVLHGTARVIAAFSFQGNESGPQNMQFLVYLLTILMVAISTVLLEVHWLASPDPQPKPIIQAGPPPPPKTEGPNEALSPIYPKKVEAPRPAEPANSQSQDAPPNAVQTTGPAAPRLITPQQQSAATTTVAPAQEPGPPAQAVQQSAPPPAQQPATAQTTGSMVAAQPAAPPQQTVTAPQGASPQPSGANAASQQESLRETTGAAVREENTRQASADPYAFTEPR
jgi:hypothetical protein